MYCYVNIHSHEIANLVFFRTVSSNEDSSPKKLRDSTFSPTGQHKSGLEFLVKRINVLLFALEIICIGPVSFPTEKRAFFASEPISKKLVFKQRF